MKPWVALVMLVPWAGCGDDSVCIDDVCADPEETRTFPGPCTSRIHYRLDDLPGDTRENLTTGTFEYDAAGRLTRVETDFDGWGGSMHNTRIQRVTETRWAYDGTGAVQEVHGPETTWTFDPQRVTAVTLTGAGPVTDLYDRAAFAFQPLPGRQERMYPAAVLGQLSSESSSGIETFTWTRVGQVATRTSVYSRDGSTTTLVLQLDDRDHIVSHQYTDPSGHKRGSTAVFDGDRLIEEAFDLSVIRYRYDRGGNLIEVDDGNPWTREVFSYDCWR